MKIHKIAILLSFTFLTITCLGQKGIVFKMHLSPKMEYAQKMTTSTENTIHYTGSEAFLASLKDRGTTNPEVSKRSSHSETSLLTGAESAKGQFPLTIEFIKSDRGDGKVLVPNGTKIYGTDSIGQRPVLDSVSVKEMSESSKQSFMRSIQSTFVQINFPERKLKPGDTFIQQNPLSIPVAGEKVEILITTTYTLVSVENNVAVFDLSQVHTMESEETKFKISASGTGSGTIKFDVKNHYFLDYDTEVEMTMSMDFGDYLMNIDQKTTIGQHTSITKR